MTAAWSVTELERIGRADELRIAARRTDGTLGRRLPIWTVCVGEHVYVRTWYRRENGWFGQVLESHRARISVPGLEADVAVQDVGGGTAELRAQIDDAYRVKYKRYGPGTVDRMVTDDAAIATLRLIPEHAA